MKKIECSLTEWGLVLEVEKTGHVSVSYNIPNVMRFNVMRSCGIEGVILKLWCLLRMAYMYNATQKWHECSFN